MQLLIILGPALLAFYIGKWTDDVWLAVGVFIGAFFTAAANWREEPALMRHIEFDENETTSSHDDPQENQDKGLLNTVLCVLGVSWLLGGDKDDG